VDSCITGHTPIAIDERLKPHKNDFNAKPEEEKTKNGFDKQKQQRGRVNECRDRGLLEGPAVEGCSACEWLSSSVHTNTAIDSYEGRVRNLAIPWAKPKLTFGLTA